jgi:hypothetical protein
MNAIINTFRHSGLNVELIGRIAPSCRGGMVRCKVKEDVEGYTKDRLYDFNVRDMITSLDLSNLPEVEW